MTWRRIRRGGTWGPWHAEYVWPGHPQAWCGSRLTGFIHDRIDDPGADARRCRACVDAVAAGRPRAYRRR